MDINIFKGRGIDDIMYLIEEDEKNGYYYIWCERVFDILRYSDTWLQIKPISYSFSKEEITSECIRINTEKYGKKYDMWLMGYK